MLVQLFGKPGFFSEEHPGQLVVYLDTSDRPECGVIGGKNATVVQLPQKGDDIGSHYQKFALVPDTSQVSPSAYVQQYHFIVTKSLSSVYAGEYLRGEELVLTMEIFDPQGDRIIGWHVDFAGVIVSLPDYKPT